MSWSGDSKMSSFTNLVSRLEAWSWLGLSTRVLTHGSLQHGIRVVEGSGLPETVLQENVSGGCQYFKPGSNNWHSITSTIFCWSKQITELTQIQGEGIYTLALHGRDIREFVAMFNMSQYILWSLIFHIPSQCKNTFTLSEGPQTSHLMTISGPRHH